MVYPIFLVVMTRVMDNNSEQPPIDKNEEDNFFLEWNFNLTSIEWATFIVVFSGESVVSKRQSRKNSHVVKLW